MSKMTLLLTATRHRLQLAFSGLQGLVLPGLRLMVQDSEQNAAEETGYVDLLGFSSKSDRGTV